MIESVGVDERPAVGARAVDVGETVSVGKLANREHLAGKASHLRVAGQRRNPSSDVGR